MAREQVAGAIILDTLRDRIISGLYLGLWRPGERLPSIREIAETENVDRKTAAAAYRRLQEEGLVEVRPRSGVYLSRTAGPSAPGPLERLHRQWLKQTYEGARKLGLETRAILELVRSVSEVEQLRIPVIECNWAQAESIAEEVRDRIGVQVVPYLLGEVRPRDPLLTDVPVLVTTPYHSAELGLFASDGRIIIEVTTAPAVLDELKQRLTTTRLAIITANRQITEKIERALRHGGFLGEESPHRIISLDTCSDLAQATQHVSHAFLWPGTPPWADDALPAHVESVRPRRIIAEESLTRLQNALLDAAVRRVRSSVGKEKVRVG